ncbi:MAG TPA: NADH-ubiquinone oxidoreductase-F iron-sulfur binding region domain-containing protein [Acidimicrobiales bacterium]|nr:NADH-ubiquinone oxidoreductase-F iron-sulfur binding region domain-containing protein [Acidimicrobiales bacterium]
MARLQRVLDDAPVPSLDAYLAAGGGKGLEAARAVEPVAVIEVLEASGLRGRGGAGFPTGTKWRTVAGLGGAEPATVVVNAAEGEPGTFKDRTLVRRNPYRVLEGALVAAHAVGADRALVGLTSSSTTERTRIEAAIAELRAAGWEQEVALGVFDGSDRYLTGEETALLEVSVGRPPFPRVAPPYRAGQEQVGDDPTEEAGTELADAEGTTGAPSTLVNNVETLANVPAIVERGPDWFRSAGTTDSPGTIVCTVSGRTQQAGVGEYELGTPLRQVLTELGGGPLGARIVAVLSGTANPFLPGDALDAPLSWEGLAAAGGGLGSAGFIVIDDEIDIVAVAHGVSRFLAVESCGQCTPCKQDGLGIAARLDDARRSQPVDLDELRVMADRITDGARCYLARQHQDVVRSLLERFPDALAAHLDGRAAGAEPFPIVPLHDIVDGQAVLALEQLEVSADWQVGADSGASPAERLDVRLRA